MVHLASSSAPLMRFGHSQPGTTRRDAQFPGHHAGSSCPGDAAPHRLSRRRFCAKFGHRDKNDGGVACHVQDNHPGARLPAGLIPSPRPGGHHAAGCRATGRGDMPAWPPTAGPQNGAGIGPAWLARQVLLARALWRATAPCAAERLGGGPAASPGRDLAGRVIGPGAGGMAGGPSLPRRGSPGLARGSPGAFSKPRAVAGSPHPQPTPGRRRGHALLGRLLAGDERRSTCAGPRGDDMLAVLQVVEEDDPARRDLLLGPPSCSATSWPWPGATWRAR